MYNYKLTLIGEHQKKDPQSHFTNLDEFYSVEFDSIDALISNLLRSEAHLIAKGIGAVVSRHYKERDQALVVLRKDFNHNYFLFFLNENGFQEVKRKYPGGLIARGSNPFGNSRLRLICLDCTTFYLHTMDVTDELVHDLKQIEAENGIRRFSPGVIIYQQRSHEDWICKTEKAFDVIKSRGYPLKLQQKVYESFCLVSQPAS